MDAFCLNISLGRIVQQFSLYIIFTMERPSKADTASLINVNYLSKGPQKYYALNIIQAFWKCEQNLSVCPTLSEFGTSECPIVFRPCWAFCYIRVRETGNKVQNSVAFPDTNSGADKVQRLHDLGSRWSFTSVRS